MLSKYMNEMNRFSYKIEHRALSTSLRDEWFQCMIPPILSLVLGLERFRKCGSLARPPSLRLRRCGQASDCLSSLALGQSPYIQPFLLKYPYSTIALMIIVITTTQKFNPPWKKPSVNGRSRFIPKMLATRVSGRVIEANMVRTFITSLIFVERRAWLVSSRASIVSFWVCRVFKILE